MCHEGLSYVVLFANDTFLNNTHADAGRSRQFQHSIRCTVDNMPPALPLKLLLSTSSKYSTTTFFPNSLTASLYKRRLGFLNSRISLTPRIGHRYFYGHISDHKMAPQLEPFFKQFVMAIRTLISCSLFTNAVLPGSMTFRTRSLTVCFFPDCRNLA